MVNFILERNLIVRRYSNSAQKRQHDCSTAQQAERWLERHLGQPPQRHLDMRGFAKYNPLAGLQVRLERAYNLPLAPLATPADEAQAYIKMTDTLLSWSDTLSASVYTQISDVELECDGFLNYDRTNKFGERDTAAIREANLRLTRPK